MLALTKFPVQNWSEILASIISIYYGIIGRFFKSTLTLCAYNKTGLSATTKYKNADKWSSQDKFTVVLETANLTEIEFSEYCRKKGIYPEQVKEWKEACMNANNAEKEQNSKAGKELREERRQKEKLEKELRRKEKALAETAALLVLRKKADAIWGTDEEDD